MTTTRRLPSLGNGIYRVADVSRYAHIPTGTVHSWFRPAEGRREVLGSDYVTIDKTFTVSFLDLIDTVVAYQFRKLNVPMAIVRRAYEKLAIALNTDHPFCYKGLFTDHKRIFFDAVVAIGQKKLQDAVSDQLLFNEIKDTLDHVSYSSKSKLAERWHLFPGVVIDPRVALGCPVIDGTGVTTFVLAQSYHVNDDNATFVGGLYGLSASQIRTAVKFEDSLRPAA